MGATTGTRFARHAILAVALVATFASPPAPAQGSGNPTTIGRLDPAAPLHARLPADILAAGAITTGVIVQEPPTMFRGTQSRGLEGSDAELLAALSAQLGIPFRLVPTEYGAFVPGLQARRYDLVAAFIADTRERQGVVDFIDYYRTRDVALARAASTLKVDSLADLCGHSVAIDQGHYLLPQLNVQKSTCRKTGAGDLRLDIFLGGPASLQALRSGRSEVVVASGATALYAVKMTDGELKIISTNAIGNPVLVGYAVRKGNAGVRDAVHAAFAAIMEDGQYRRILETWGLAEGALERPYINAGANAAAPRASRSAR